MTRLIRLLAPILAALLLTGAALADTVAIPPGTTLIALRHADRTTEDLNARGIARAAALPAALDGVPIHAIFSPGFDRNLDTAAPLAEARGLQITRMTPKNAAARILAASAGKTVVWVGNKTNLSEIWEDIGADGPPPLAYGDLFFVTADASGRPVVTRKRFGEG